MSGVLSARPTTSAPGVARTVALPLGLGGLLIAVGGELHPHDTKDTVHDTLEHYLASSTWNGSHLLLLAGIVIAVIGMVQARRAEAFGRTVQPALSVAIWCWALAAVELIPHLLATRDRDALHDHGSTPILDAHLWLNVFATPMFGLSAAVLAIAIARSSRTKPATALAAFAVIGGLAYAVAGPQIKLVGNIDLSILFAGQAPVALWLIGTAVRIARGSRPAVRRPDDATTLRDGLDIRDPASPVPTRATV